jgi:hypothetical protein
MPGNPSDRKTLSRRLYFFPCYKSGEMLEGTIISPFGFFGKTAGRQLPAFQVIMKAFAADALPGTPAVTAIAVVQVLVLPAVHRSFPQ